MRMNAGFEILACDISSSGIYEAFVRNVTEPRNYVNESGPSLPSIQIDYRFGDMARSSS